MDTSTRYTKYQRQMILPGMGVAGQQALANARVLVVGAGGLGCPVLQYLAAAGVGTIGLVDDDIVSLTNLHRQVLYTMADIGKPKVNSAAEVLRRMNPDTSIDTYPFRLTTANALELISEYDIVVDGSDNFATRYMVNDACVIAGKPLVFGAISRFEGQVAVFNVVGADGHRGVNYRDLFATPPEPGTVLNCAEAGVIGVLPGIVGSMMANETIKLITGIGELLSGKLLTYNSLNNQVFELGLSPADKPIAPIDIAAFKDFYYGWECAVNAVHELSAEQFDAMRSNADVLVLDVREIGELPTAPFEHLQLPLSGLSNCTELPASKVLVTFCQSGKRSKQAAEILFNTFGATRKIYSLQGGIVGWTNKQQNND